MLAQDVAVDSTSRTDDADPTGWTIGPPGHVYPYYLADPRRPQTSAGLNFARNSDLMDQYGNGTVRTDIRLGGRVPLVRYTASNAMAWEICVEGGFFGYFDASQSLENIGWDGRYGLLLGWRFATGFSTKIHLRHLSSHLGDEFIERTGRERIGYTREDVTLGLAWEPVSGGTVYGEIGLGIHDGAARQETSVFQFGGQYRGGQTSKLLGVFGWQAAADIQLYEEEDYTPEITLQAALLLPMAREEQQIRFAIEYHSGRALLGELSDLDEDYVAFLVGWDF